VPRKNFVLFFYKKIDAQLTFIFKVAKFWNNLSKYSWYTSIQTYLVI